MAEEHVDIHSENEIQEAMDLITAGDIESHLDDPDEDEDTQEEIKDDSDPDPEEKKGIKKKVSEKAFKIRAERRARLAEIRNKENELLTYKSQLENFANENKIARNLIVNGLREGKLDEVAEFLGYTDWNDVMQYVVEKSVGIDAEAKRARKQAEQQAEQERQRQYQEQIAQQQMAVKKQQAQYMQGLANELVKSYPREIIDETFIANVFEMQRKSYDEISGTIISPEAAAQKVLQKYEKIYNQLSSVFGKKKAEAMMDQIDLTPEIKPQKKTKSQERNSRSSLHSEDDMARAIRLLNRGQK